MVDKFKMENKIIYSGPVYMEVGGHPMSIVFTSSVYMRAIGLP